MFDRIFLEKEYGNKIPKRIAEYERSVACYLEFVKRDVQVTVVFKEDTSTLLTYLYFNWLHYLVKPFIKELCDRYKVASITEFAVCYLQPISIMGISADKIRAINADFAFFCAFNIMSNFNDDEDTIHFGTSHFKPFTGAIAPLEDRLEKVVLENHKLYLANFSVTHQAPPVILNAQSLELIDMFYSFKWQALSV